MENSANSSASEFDEKFAKLVKNREKVPLEILETRYKAAYGRLCSEITGHADRLIDEAVEAIAIRPDPSDREGCMGLQRKVEAIKARERMPGGAYHEMHEGLIRGLDRGSIGRGAERVVQRIEEEAYAPYVRRFNRETGTLRRRRIYNSLFKAFWMPGSGRWVNIRGEAVMVGYPPETERTKGEKA